MGPTRTSAAAGIVIRGRVNPIVSLGLVPVVGALIRGFGLGEKTSDFSARFKFSAQKPPGKSRNGRILGVVATMMVSLV